MAEMIFEIFNKDGVLTRRGRVKKGSLNIDIQQGDYRYIIRDEFDPTLVYQQGYLQQPPSKAESNPYPVLITEMDGQSISLFCNTFKDGHTALCYQEADNPSSKEEIELTSPSAKLDLKPGKYLVYTRSESETSFATEVLVLGETREELLEQAKRNIVDYSEQHEMIFAEILERIKEDEALGVYEAVQNAYLEVAKEDKQLLIASYDILFQVERIRNSRKQLSNEKQFSATKIDVVPQGFIQVGSEITKIFVYEIKNGHRLFVYSIATVNSKGHTIAFRKDSLHLLELYAGSNLASCFDVFCPDENIKSAKWSLTKESVDLTEEVEERAFLSLGNQTEISDEDKRKLSVELYKRPFYQIVSAPDVSFADDEVEIYIQEYEMLRRLEKPLYLTIKRTDKVFYPNETTRILMTDSTMRLNSIKDGIYPDTSYFAWIEDEKQQVLSSMRLMSSNQEDMYSYGLLSRQVAIRAYQDRVIGHVSKYYDHAPKLLKEEIDQISTIAEVSVNDLYKSLIAKLSMNKDTKMFNSMTSLILQDKYSNSTVNERFFGNKALFNRANKTLIFPDRYFEYIIQVDSFNIGDQEMNTRYYNIKDGAGVVKLENNDYFIVSAIDKDSYARSGYVLLNTFKIDAVLDSWKLGIEVK